MGSLRCFFEFAFCLFAEVVRARWVSCRCSAAASAGASGDLRPVCFDGFANVFDGPEVVAFCVVVASSRSTGMFRLKVPRVDSTPPSRLVAWAACFGGVTFGLGADFWTGAASVVAAGPAVAAFLACSSRWS